MSDKLEATELQKYKEILTVELPENVRGLFPLLSPYSTSPICLIGSTVRKIIRGESSFNDFDFVGQFDFNTLEIILQQYVIRRYYEDDVLKLNINGQEVDLLNSPSIIEALNDRDITISLMCLDREGKVYDPLGVFNDFQKGVVRILNPDEKIAEDPVRGLRVLRFAMDLGFTIEAETLTAAMKNIENLELDIQVENELKKISRLSASKRQQFIELIELLDIKPIVIELIKQCGERKLTTDLNLNFMISEIATLLGSDEFIVFGGALRDTFLGKDFADIDIKLYGDAHSLIRNLELQGYIETEDTDVPSETYYFNHRFNAVSIRMNGILCDITFFQKEVDLENWYSDCDLNMNALLLDVTNRRLLNPWLIPEVYFGVLALCDRNTVDPLKQVNFLKQFSRNANLIIDTLSLEHIVNQLEALCIYFLSNKRMLYKFESILNNRNSEIVLSLIKQTESGKQLLLLINK